MKVLNEEALRKKLGVKDETSFKDELKEELKKEKDPESELNKYLLGLLARREYSQKELRTKAKARAFSDEVIETILSKLADENYQSDARYCEMLIRSRVNKQSGPFKVRMELKQKGVAESLIEKALSETDCDWFECARLAAEKKSFNWKVKDAQHKAKLMRFLQGRGFDGEQINYALKENGF